MGKRKRLLIVIFTMILTLAVGMLTGCMTDDGDSSNAPSSINRPDESVSSSVSKTSENTEDAENTETGDTEDTEDTENTEDTGSTADTSNTEDTGDVHEHVYGEWRQTAAPTCTTAGEERRDCKNCDGYETRTITALGHDEEEHAAKAATCVEVGWNAYVTCSRCDYTTYVEIPAKGHTEVTDEAVAETCDTDGKTQGKHCSVCGMVIVVQTTIPAKGHKYENGKCKYCGETESDLASLNVYNGRYGYNYFGNTENGDKKQVLYNRINKAVKAFHADEKRNGSTDFAVETINYSDLGFDTDTAISVWKTYRDDNPLYYWLSTTIQYTVTDITILVDPDYSDGAVRAKANQKVYDSVKSYAARLGVDDGIYRKTLAYHDYIIEAVDYAYDSDNNPQSAGWAHSVIGVFDEKGSVCEGYAKTFQLLLNYSGVENVLVTGTSSGEGHAWNLVKLDDGEWYWYDLTYDDTPSYKWGISYNYFCVTDETNTLWSEAWSYPQTESFLQSHTFSTSDGIRGEFLYDLPVRSASEFSSDGQIILNDKFTVDNATFAVVGYNALEIRSIGGAKNVAIPETVDYGGDIYTVISVGVHSYASYGQVAVNGVQTIFIPKTVKFIWGGAFVTSTLEEINVDENNENFISVDGVLYTKSLYTLISYPASNKRTEYVIFNDTKMIADRAFLLKCRKLEKLTIGANVRVIGIANLGEGFYDSDEDVPSMSNIIADAIQNIVDSLVGDKEIIIDEKNKSYSCDGYAIYNYAKTYMICFVNYNIDEFEIPATLELFWPAFDFKQLKCLKRYTVESGNKIFSVVDGVLYNKDKTEIIAVPPAIEGEITIPDTITEIYEYKELQYGSVTSYTSIGFRDCKNLTAINLPKDLKIIGSSAFKGCSGLVSIIIPESVKSIGAMAFSGCSGLLSVEIPDGVENIEDSVFSYCSSLTSVTIPSSVTTISGSAFYKCIGLTNLTIPNSVKSIGSMAFSQCNGLVDIVIPNSVTSLESYVFSDCINLESVTIGNGVKIIKGVAFGGCSKLKNVIFGNSVTDIEDQVFIDCVSLAEITIPDSVTSIMSGAFKGCKGLKSVTIGRGISSIGDWFSGCTGLDNIVIPDTVTAIGNGAFSMCSGLVSIVIPDSVTRIGVGAFRGCASLKKITISKNVTIIDWVAFEGCNNLTDIEFGGTMEQWNSISLSSGWNSNSCDCTVHCIDGDIEKA